MTVTLNISNTSGGDPLPSLNDLGTVTPGEESEFIDLFISHSALVEPIVDCAFYLAKYSGQDYTGEDADADLAEVLEWGDTDHGGGATGGFYMSQTPDPGWIIGTIFTGGWEVFHNGNGTIDNQIILSQNSIVIGDPEGEDGIIPVSGEAHIQVQWKVPSTESVAGDRNIMLVMAYSATS